MPPRTLALTLLPLLLLLGCGGAPAPTGDETIPPQPVVAVSIPPQASWVELLAGGAVRAEVLVPPGRSPDTYEPTPQQMAGIADALLYVRLGMPFEAGLLPRLRRVAPELEVVDGARGIPLMPIEAVSIADQGAGHEHDHGHLDPHFWLDPTLVAQHLPLLARALAERLPERAAAIAQARDEYVAELHAADERIRRRLEPFAGRELFVYHPAWGYLTRRYGLRQVAVEVAGREPSPKELTAFVAAARRAGITTVFVQPQFATGAARTLAAAVGADIMVLDPLAADYIPNLEDMTERIASAMEGT